MAWRIQSELLQVGLAMDRACAIFHAIAPAGVSGAPSSLRLTAGPRRTIPSDNCSALACVATLPLNRKRPGRERPRNFTRNGSKG